MPYLIDDADLDAFLVYAMRERNLDAAQRQADAQSASNDHRTSLAVLRELNLRLLIRDTTRTKFS
jgi:hypothetical protein